MIQDKNGKRALSYSSRTINVNDLLNRAKDQRKKERKNNIIIAAAAVSVMAITSLAIFN